MTRGRIGGATGIARHLTLALFAIMPIAAVLPLVVADEPPQEWDGLARVSSKKLDHVYKLPEADFSGYKLVRLDPIEVEFDKNWKPNASERSPSRRLTDDDIVKIKQELAEEFRKVFTEELTETATRS